MVTWQATCGHAAAHDDGLCAVGDPLRPARQERGQQGGGGGGPDGGARVAAGGRRARGGRRRGRGRLHTDRAVQGEQVPRSLRKRRGRQDGQDRADQLPHRQIGGACLSGQSWTRGWGQGGEKIGPGE
eukprot:2208487-Pleurochrysis_carterae.AAC.1